MSALPQTPVADAAAPSAAVAHTSLTLVGVEEYLEAELSGREKHEYVGGRLYAMAGAKINHNRVAANFSIATGSRLRGKPCESFNSDTKVRVRFSDHTRFYYPDGMVVCESNPGDQSFQDRPVLIAEVLSESTRRIDEGEKREAYLSIPSLKLYLLIDPDRPCVTAYRRGEQGFGIELYEGLDASIPFFDEIGGELPLAELYERIDLKNSSEKTEA